MKPLKYDASYSSVTCIPLIVDDIESKGKEGQGELVEDVFRSENGWRERVLGIQE
jgi:hypothetical protein